MFQIAVFLVGAALFLIAMFRKKAPNNSVGPSMMVASSDSAFECGVCNEDYDSGQHKPLVLMCGHTFCRTCLLRIASEYDKRCPNCRTQIAQRVDKLAVNYALIQSEKKASPAKPSDPADLCKSHRCQLEYLCVDCGDLGCWKCSRDFHFNHRVESFEDIMRDDAVAYARTELRQKIQGKLDELKASLLIPAKMLKLFEDLKKYERELEDWLDFRHVMESSVLKDLQMWDALTSNPGQENRKTFRDIVRRLNEVKPPQVQSLLHIRRQMTELSKKAAELGNFVQESADDSNSGFPHNEDTPKLLPNNQHWQVCSESSVKSAIAAVRARRRPTTVSVVSLPSDPIRRLPARLNVLGNACVGAMEVKPLDAFWKASTGTDERLQSFIEKHGHKVSEFYGSPDDALVCSASRQAPLSLGVRLCNASDLDRCSALTVKPYSVCCIPGLPAAAGARMQELGWRPFLWHFPDLNDPDLDWMMTILGSFVPSPPPVVQPVWTICAAFLGMRLFRCLLPRCSLSEEGFRKLLERYPDYAPVICCETASLSAKSRERLTALAEKKQIQLRWETLSQTHSEF